jgi:hypothetical protein
MEDCHRHPSKGTSMTKELKRFEQWWDAGDDIPNDGPYTPDTPIQFAWAGWQAALAQPEQEPATLPHEMTPEMLRQVQTQSELGAYAAANFSGAYDLFNEFWRVAIAAAPQRTWVYLTDEQVRQTWHEGKDHLGIAKVLQDKFISKNT